MPSRLRPPQNLLSFPRQPQQEEASVPKAGRAREAWGKGLFFAERDSTLSCPHSPSVSQSPAFYLHLPVSPRKAGTSLPIGTEDQSRPHLLLHPRELLSPCLGPIPSVALRAPGTSLCEDTNTHATRCSRETQKLRDRNHTSEARVWKRQQGGKGSSPYSSSSCAGAVQQPPIENLRHNF